MIIEFNDLHFSHGSHKIFENASIKIPHGTITGILGPNGAGKTTLFDILSGIAIPTHGKIHVRTNKIQYLLQTISSPNLKFGDIFRLMKALKGENTSIDLAHKHLAKLAPELSLKFKSLLNKHPRHCSYGQVRCFYTICYLAMDSNLLILDEPTAGVDAENHHYIWTAIKQAAQQGTTVLASSHHIEEVAERCDNFYMINNYQLDFYPSSEKFHETFGGDNLNQAFIRSLHRT